MKKGTKNNNKKLFLFVSHSSKHWTEKQHSSTKKDKLFHFSSHFSVFIKIPSTGLKNNIAQSYQKIYFTYLIFHCF